VNALRSIADRRFRSNPRYELLLFEQLTRGQREGLSALEKDQWSYAVLIPRPDSGLAVKSVCEETALLYRTLQTPGPIPSDVKRRHADRCNEAIAELVLQGVFEVEDKRRFTSGPDAYRTLFGAKHIYEPRGKVARLSLDALIYAQSLDIVDPARLSTRLYFYNRGPASPKRLRQFPSSDALEAGLFKERTKREFERYWRRLPPSPEADCWLSWQSRSFTHPPDDALGYKLYISPTFDGVSDVLAETMAVLSQSRAHHFKIGKDVYGLLRPDKMVAYFADRVALEDTADALLERVDGCAAQGVPFTAELRGDGLLSWGIDPPIHERTLIASERESWRLWITNRLATALVVSKRSGNACVEPWRFALELLRLKGIDIETWTPRSTMWQSRGLDHGHA
jgi:hypothetical protein